MPHLSSVNNICKSTPCFNFLKLSMSININPSILNYVLQSLQTSLSEAGKLSNSSNLSDLCCNTYVEPAGWADYWFVNKSLERIRWTLELPPARNFELQANDYQQIQWTRNISSYNSRGQNRSYCTEHGLDKGAYVSAPLSLFYFPLLFVLCYLGWV